MDAEVIIIGGGAAGMSAAMLLGRQQRETILIDSHDYRNAPSPAINMLIASDHISPADYYHNAKQALAKLDTVLRVGASVSKVDAEPPSDSDAPQHITVTLHDGRTLTAARLLLATGHHDQVGASCGISGIPDLWGTKVLHCPYCHGYETRGRSIAVLGNTNPMAVHQARYLRDRFSEHVTLIGTTEGADINATVQRVEPTPTGIRIHHTAGTLDTDVAFYQAASVAAAPFAAQLGLRTQGPADEWIVVDHQQRTSHPLVYAAGDCCARAEETPLPFVAQAQAQGQAAALWIDQSLFFS